MPEQHIIFVQGDMNVMDISNERKSLSLWQTEQRLQFGTL